jgi:hypothetical protein
MLTAALVLFAAAASGGVVLAFLHITGKGGPVGLACLHGALAVLGVVLVLMGIGQGHGSTGVTAALVLFLIAAVGGLVLFVTHLRSRPLPVPLILVHGLVAVTAFLTLLVTVVWHTA